jgi:hypothetical protein
MARKTSYVTRDLGNLKSFKYFLLLLWGYYILCFGDIYLLPWLLLNSLITLTQIYVLKIIYDQFVLSHFIMCGLLLENVQLSGDNILYKTDSLSPSEVLIYHMSWLRMGLHIFLTYPCWHLVFIYIVWVCAHCHHPWGNLHV